MSGYALALFFLGSLCVEVAFPYANISISWFRNYFKNFALGAVSFLGTYYFSRWEILPQLGLRFLDLRAWPLVIQVFLALLILDLSSYVWHRANHRFRFLWRFHSVHHLDTQLNSASSVRFHFAEVIMGHFYRLGFVWILGFEVSAIAIFQIVYMALNIFQHSNIDLNRSIDRILGLLFVTPGIHRIHHSKAPCEVDLNFSTIFSFWDRLFKTFKSESEIFPVSMGLPKYKGADLSFAELLRYPFRSRPD